MRRLKSAPNGPDAVPPQKKFLGALCAVSSSFFSAIRILLFYFPFI